MKINEIEKNEWKEVFDLYFEEKERFGDSVTIEDILAYTRRCENCDKLVLVDDMTDELPTIEAWNHETLHCCNECYEDEMDSDCHYDNDEPDYYQEYIDYQLVSE